jgi:hypothetical protein
LFVVVRSVVVVVACGMTGAVVSVVVVRVVVVTGGASLPQPARAPIETIRAVPMAMARIEFAVLVILKPSAIVYSSIQTVASPQKFPVPYSETRRW